MGTDIGGASCEWIELYNGGSDIIDLSTWSIVITNAGNATAKVLDLGEDASQQYAGIAGNGFYLIARSTGACATLAPGLTADWRGNFGNGISNTGAKLELFNGAEKVDSVNAEAGWGVTGGIGGKNPSSGAKETPQYSGGTWIAALPTPRSMNAAVPVDTLPDDHDDASTSTPAVTVGGSTPSIPVASPIIKLYLDPGPSRIVSVGAHTPFEAIVYDGTGKIRNDAEVLWNFGDGGREKGESVSYAYREAGEYSVVVRAKAKSQSAIAMLSVVADAALVRVATTSDTGVVVTNDGDRLVDLSLWKVSTGKKKFTLPEDTVLPPRASLRLASAVTGLPTSTAPVLLFPNGSLASALEQPQASIASIETEQEVVPVAAAPLTLPPYAQYSHAPAVAPQPAAVGAAVPPQGNVILKKDAQSGLGSFLKGLLASVLLFVVP